MLLATLIGLSLALTPAADKDYEQALTAGLDRAFPGAFGFEQGGMAPPGDRLLFEDTLASDAFLHRAVGPFDLYVYKADGLRIDSIARTVADRAAAGLEPLAKLMERRFGRSSGVLSGQRFPLVLCKADVAHGQKAFDELIALLDWCENDWTGWTTDNGSLWTKPLREGLVVRTWDVQLLNLADKLAAEAPDEFLDHGLGYYTIAHLMNRLLRQGSWGMVPPWLDQGLMDELDIEAYGRAWVGGDWFVAETAGWFRPGWSGFVPEGASPPPPVTGPPADLATTVRDTGDSWAHRNNSVTRHWSNLVADLDSAYPPSFAFMAENESFLPRDRAFARCAMHLLLELAPGDAPDLLELLDHPAHQMPNGMFDSEPLPALFAKALGRTGDTSELAAMPLRQKLRDLNRAAIEGRIHELGGDGALAIPDHRKQGDWLLNQPDIAWDARRELFDLFLEGEHYEQMRDWELLSPALDEAVYAALAASEVYPAKPAARSKVAAAFRDALRR